MLKDFLRALKGKGVDKQELLRQQDAGLRIGGVATSNVTVEQVKEYYEAYTLDYIKGFGDVFQGVTSADINFMLDTCITDVGIEDGMRVLDAGCGVCGPSIWFAGKKDIQIEAVTISDVQVSEGKKRIAANGLEEKINLQQGDYHHLSELYPPASFDRVLFLESLCHAENYRQVLSEAFKVLKNYGKIYIKDYYVIDNRARPSVLQDQTIDILDVNEQYRMTMPRISEVVELLGETGFLLEFVRQPTWPLTNEAWLKYEEVSGQNYSQVRKLKRFELAFTIFEALWIKVE